MCSNLWSRNQLMGKIFCVPSEPYFTCFQQCSIGYFFERVWHRMESYLVLLKLISHYVPNLFKLLLVEPWITVQLHTHDYINIINKYQAFCISEVISQTCTESGAHESQSNRWLCNKQAIGSIIIIIIYFLCFGLTTIVLYLKTKSLFCM